MQTFRPSRFEILPPVIKNLLIINGLFLLADYTFERQGFGLDNLFALHAWDSPLFKPWQLLTHMFMHANIGHIVGNMFALWMFGSILEGLWGSKRFLVFYLTCGLGAALLHLIFLWMENHQLFRDFAMVAVHSADTRYFSSTLLQFIAANDIASYFDDKQYQVLEHLQQNPQDHAAANFLYDLSRQVVEFKRDVPTVGASGAVFGVLAAFIYLFPNTYIYLYFFVPIKAKWLGLLYFGFEIFSALQHSAGDNVARWAHIGGGLVGFLLVYTWNKKNRRTFY